MHKLQLSLIVLAVFSVGCKDKNPVGPGTIETLTRPPNGAPVVVVTGPTDGSNLSAGKPVVLSGTANDVEDGGSAELIWSSSLDGELGTGSSVSVSLSPGTHAITASATDSDGIVGNATVTVTVAAAAAPVVTIESPGDGAEFVPGTKITFVATAVDLEDGDLSSEIVWESTLDGVLGTGPSITKELNRLSTRFVSATVVDSSGLTGTAAISLKIANAEPGSGPGAPNKAPEVVITGPADGTEFTLGAEVTFTGSATDAEDGDLSSKIDWHDGTKFLGTGEAVTVRLSTARTYSISAQVRDSGRLTTIVSITVESCVAGAACRRD